MSSRADEIRERILELVAQYYSIRFADRPFVPGESPVPVSGKVFDAVEMRSLVDSGLDFWLTTGRFAQKFEHEFARVCGVRAALLVN